MSLMTFTPERARAMIQSMVMMRGNRGEDDLVRQTGGGHAKYVECRKLARLEVVHLVDEPLKFHDGVASLVRSQVLIDG